MVQQKEAILLEFREQFHGEKVYLKHLYRIKLPNSFMYPKSRVMDEPFNKGVVNNE